MLQAILLDLDDTLLGNNMDTFIPHYFDLLGQKAQQFLEKERFFREMLLSTRMMMANTDTAVANHEAFWQTFVERTGLNRAELEPFFEQFYRHEFSQLQSVTQLRPVAAELVQACFDKGLKVVVATNPVFPSSAVEARLEWAGVPVTQFPYDMVTTYENMNATKPHRQYYHQILNEIGCAPEAALMVGDDWKNDIVPAADMGMFTYWIRPHSQALPADETLVTAYGSLDELYALISSGWLEHLPQK